jgi:hypothetical protein
MNAPALAARRPGRARLGWRSRRNSPARTRDTISDAHRLGSPLWSQCGPVRVRWPTYCASVAIKWGAALRPSVHCRLETLAPERRKTARGTTIRTSERGGCCWAGVFAFPLVKLPSTGRSRPGGRSLTLAAWAARQCLRLGFQTACLHQHRGAPAPPVSNSTARDIPKRKGDCSPLLHDAFGWQIADVGQSGKPWICQAGAASQCVLLLKSWRCQAGATPPCVLSLALHATPGPAR